MELAAMAAEAVPSKRTSPVQASARSEAVTSELKSLPLESTIPEPVTAVMEEPSLTGIVPETSIEVPVRVVEIVAEVEAEIND